MTDNLGNRVPILKALVGSHNYNLNTPDSDKDYKVFVLPVFDDLFYKDEYSENTESDENDISFADIRKLSSLFYKSNVNWLEVLYSQELEILLPKDHKSYEDVKSILMQREQLCKMNMSYLLHACKGMYLNNIKTMTSENTKHYDEKLKYSPKHAMNAYRIMDFLKRYKYFIENQADHPFKLAINYFDKKEQSELLTIKNGAYSLEQIKSILVTKYNVTMESCKEFYVSKKPNEELLKWLDNKLKKIVKDNI